MPQDLTTSTLISHLRIAWRGSVRRSARLIGLLVLSLFTLVTHAQTANDGFNPKAEDGVFKSLVQSDGRIIVAGAFTSMGGVPIQGLARLNTDGSVDTQFNVGSGLNGGVSVIASADDSCASYVGGDFTKINGMPVNRVVRFRCNGQIDSSFSFPATVTGDVFAIATQPDGNVLIAGRFASLGGGTTSVNLGRLSATGAPDTSFNVTVDSDVRSIAIQPDGKILIGGVFASVNGQPRTQFARLNVDGSLDNSYNVVITGESVSGFAQVVDIALQPDGKAIIAGLFTQISGVTHDSIARINTNGSLDASFAAVFLGGANIDVVKLQPDGKVLIGGPLSTVNGNRQGGMARLKPDGTLDGFYRIRIDSSVSTIAVQADGSIVIGGAFQKVGGIVRKFIARVTRDLILDDDFDIPPTIGALNGSVSAIALGARGEVVIGGQSTFNNVSFSYAQIVNVDGSYGGSFGATFQVDAPVHAVAVQADSKVLLGGEFTRGIERAIPNRGLDPTFNPGGAGANGIVNAMTITKDGFILIAGVFTTYNGQTRFNIARLNPDGTLDGAFFGAFNLPPVLTFAVQRDGKILVGGVGFLARLNFLGDIDTSFDSSFLANAGDSIAVISYATRNNIAQIFVGGTFTQMRGVPAQNLAKISDTGVADPDFVANIDGEVKSIVQQVGSGLIVGGLFTQIDGATRSSLARLDTFSGAVLADYAFPSGANGAVFALALQPDGKLLIGGNFTSVNGIARRGIARLSAIQSAQPSLRIGVDTDNGGHFIAFGTGQFSYAETDFIQFDLSTDAINWTLLGQLSFDNGVAVMVGRTLPKGSVFYIRASTRVRSGSGNGSSSGYELIKQFYLPADPITQLLTIGPIPSHRVSDAPFSVAVNGSSGNAASFQSKTEGICTVTPSGMVSLTGQLGTCTLSATVAGNAGFTSAADTTSFEITQGTQAPPQNVICTAGVGQISCVFTGPPAAPGGDAAVPPLTGYTLSCVPASGQVGGDGSAVGIYAISGATSLFVFTGLPTGILMSCTMVTNNSVGSGAASVASLVQPYSMLSRQGGIDVNGDGKGELMLRNADGSFIGRLNSMTQQLLFTPITDVGAENRILGIGDFGGRGKSDLLLQDVVSGDVQFWMGFDGFVDSRRAVRNVKPGWNVEAVADLDGDGKTDIVWRFTSTPANPSPNPDDNGVVFIWFMNDGVISEVKHRGGAPLSWSLIGAADLHGSGMADLIYVSPTMQIRSITALANREFINEAIGTVPVGYTLARLADFTGDGKSDLLFSNPQGKLTLWVMNGINIQSQIDLPPVDPSWILLAIADLNGDGTTDLVFKKPDDTLVVWLMNASAPSSPTVIANAGAAPAGAVAVEP